MKRGLNLAILIILFVTACEPSQEEIQATVQAGIEQTLAAIPTNTFKPPTETPTAILTPSPLPTSTRTYSLLPTSTPGPSPTPEKTLIDINPRELMAKYSNLPSERYFIFPSGPHHLPNSDLMEQDAYLLEAGRIDGWAIEYWYNSRSGPIELPEEFTDTVTIYSNIERARLLVTSYELKDGETELEVPLVGDVTRAILRSTHRTAVDNLSPTINVVFTFVYKNVSHNISMRGWYTESLLEFAIHIANSLLNELKQLPLSDSVTYTP